MLRPESGYIYGPMWGQLIEAIMRVLRELFRRGASKSSMREFALSQGFEFDEQIDPVAWNLYETSFFGRFDVARNAMTGERDHTTFKYFEHDRAAGRGADAVVRSIVVFNVGPRSSRYDPHSGDRGWTVEKSDGRVFMWRSKEKEPVQAFEMKPFLDAALRAYRKL
jgi:hypothetical protein